MNKEEYKKEVFNWLTIAGKKPNQEMIDLSDKLIAEEYQELEDAFTARDEIQIMDALIDITWVLHNKLFAVTGKNKFISNSCSVIDEVQKEIEYHLNTYIPSILFNNDISIETFNIYEKAVKDSNYSKFCLTHSEHKETQKAYLSGEHFDKLGKIIECEPAMRINNVYPVIQKNTGKILKSINYKPAEELFKLYSNNETFQ